MNNKVIVGVVIGVLVVAFGVGSIFYNKTTEQAQAKRIDSGEAQLIRDHSPALGSPMLKVSLVEFLDPECESCRMFHPVVKNILKKYDNQIHYVVRYAPFHRHSKESVAFLEAARLQGKYWETLDLLFERQPEWADHHHPKPQVKWMYLEELGLDGEKMKKDMAKAEIQEILKLDILDGQKLGIRGTPTFFINGKPLRQFGAEYLEQAISEAVGTP